MSPKCNKGHYETKAKRFDKEKRGEDHKNTEAAGEVMLPQAKGHLEPPAAG